MKKFLLLPLFLLLNFSVYSQAVFEPGYFINNEGVRIDCLIKQTDKAENLNQIEYRLSENAETKVASIKEVKEFEMLNTSSKYQRHTVKLDKFSNAINELTTEMNPTFTEEEVFLKVLVDGQASLYSFAGQKGVEIYFYSVNGSDIEQLVFRKYMTDEQLVKFNIQYKYQLLNGLKCEAITMDDFEKLKYVSKSLSKLIVKYNECVQSPYVSYGTKTKKGTVYLAVKLGANKSNLNLHQYLALGSNSSNPTGNSYLSQRTSYQDISPQFGLELAYKLPFNQNKWTIFLEPTLQLHSGEYNVQRLPASEGTVILSMTRATFPFGLKYNLYLGKDVNMFFSGAMALRYIFDSSFEFENLKVTRYSAPNHGPPLAIVPGAGIRYKQLSFELTYQFGGAKSNFKAYYRYMNHTSVRNDNWNANFRYPLSITAGYRLYNQKR